MHERLAREVIRRPPLILGAAGLIAVAAAILLTNLRIDGDFASLIPKDDPTLRLTRELQGNAPPSRILLVVLRAENADLLEEALEEIPERLENSEYLTEVAVTREEFGGSATAWFERAPLYALPDDLLHYFHEVFVQDRS